MYLLGLFYLILDAVLSVAINFDATKSNKLMYIKYKIDLIFNIEPTYNTLYIILIRKNYKMLIHLYNLLRLSYYHSPRVFQTNYHGLY